MSWLYTIVFAGLMLSSESAPLAVTAETCSVEPAAVNVVALTADETERFEQTYPLSANGRVSVSNVNGSISVDTWDRKEVKFEYVKTADAKENLSELSVRIDSRPDAFTVETDYGDWKRRASGERRTYSKLSVEYRLTVPRTAVLNEIETVNGTVNIRNAANMTKASAVNGEVRALNLRGTADLSTVNGTVVADFDQLTTGGKISLNTVNGSVDLMIPSDVNATVRADTVNGSISNDFGLPVRKGEYVGRDLYGKIGSGEVQIRLNSVNGPLAIKRKNDGRNANPAVNLLNMKNEDADEDWDDDDGVTRVRPPRMPKPPKAPKPPVVIGEIDSEAFNKEMEEGLKQASKELARIQPELQRQTAEAMRLSAIDAKEIQKQIEEAARSTERLGRLSDNYWLVGSPAVEKKSGSFGVKSKPKIKVEAQNCAVFVRGWDKPEVQYTVTRFSKSRTSAPLDPKITVNDSNVEIKLPPINGDAASDTDYFRERNRVRIEIYVPKKSDLKIATGGEIRLEGVSGDIDLQGASEAINVRDADGKLTVAADDGRIRVIGFRGAFDGKSNDGAMNLEGDFEKFSAQTVDGIIVLTLPENANVNIESNRKDLTGEGVNLAPQDDGQSTSRWKIGKGGTNHLLYTTAEGKFFVRTASALKTN